jgi:hypothetical protein
LLKHYFRIYTTGFDNEFSLTIEVIDDDKDSLEESTGQATYFNSESIIFTYISIFENLRIENTRNSVFN